MFFVKREVKNHFYAMNQILAPYSSMLEIKKLKLKHDKKIREISKYAKNSGKAKKFIEASKVDGATHIFSCIFILSRFERGALWTSEDSTAVNALFGYCKKELLKYKEYAPEIFWDILYLDKESFYEEVVEKD